MMKMRCRPIAILVVTRMCDCLMFLPVALSLCGVIVSISYVIILLSHKHAYISSVNYPAG